MKKSKTNAGLVAYAKSCVGLPYWYGTFGQVATRSLLNSKRGQYPAYYVATDFDGQIGKVVHDCVGLIKGYLWKADKTAAPIYVATQDKSACGMYEASYSRGEIKTLPNVPGVLVYKGKTDESIHHVGVYGADGYVYEAKGHMYGVVKTKFKRDEWQFWSKCPYIEYDDKKTATEAVAREVIDGKWGNGSERKSRLTGAGYNYAMVQKLVNELLKEM